MIQIHHRERRQARAPKKVFRRLKSSITVTEQLKDICGPRQNVLLKVKKNIRFHISIEVASEDLSTIDPWWEGVTGRRLKGSISVSEQDKQLRARGIFWIGDNQILLTVVV